MELDVMTQPTGIAVVVPRGRLNMVSAKRLREEVDRLVADGTTRVVVDLGETSFVDSSGIGALVAGLKTARAAGGDLRVVRPTAAVSAVLALTNLDSLLEARASVEAAFDV
jgi:anti-sigma B factor antagonist